MDELRNVANVCVGRAFAFAMLAIGVTMIGFSFNMVLALKTGGILSTVLALIFILKGLGANRKDYRHTELWITLPQDRRPPVQHAQWASSTVLREAYFSYAHHAAVLAIVMGVTCILLALLRL